MLTVDPSTTLVSITGKPIRRLAVEWRDALKLAGGIAARSPGAPVARVLESAAQAIEDGEGAAMTLGDAVVDALLSGKGAAECAGREKLRRWTLAQAFAKGAPVELAADDVVFIDACLADTYKPNVYGPAHDALESVKR